MAPDVSLAHKLLGDVAQNLGNLEEAKAAYEQALALDPKNSDLAFKIKDVESAIASSKNPSAP